MTEMTHDGIDRDETRDIRALDLHIEEHTLAINKHQLDKLIIQAEAERKRIALRHAMGPINIASINAMVEAQESQTNKIIGAKREQVVIQRKLTAIRREYARLTDEADADLAPTVDHETLIDKVLGHIFGGDMPDIPGFILEFANFIKLDDDDTHPEEDSRGEGVERERGDGQDN